MTSLGSVSVGGRNAAKVMGIINVSPESFYKGSVLTGEREIAAAAKQMQQDGAHMIDIGAMVMESACHKAARVVEDKPMTSG